MAKANTTRGIVLTEDAFNTATLEVERINSLAAVLADDGRIQGDVQLLTLVDMILDRVDKLDRTLTDNPSRVADGNPESVVLPAPTKSRKAKVARHAS